jgi:hypothetical protein
MYNYGARYQIKLGIIYFPKSKLFFILFIENNIYCYKKDLKTTDYNSM